MNNKLFFEICVGIFVGVTGWLVHRYLLLGRLRLIPAQPVAPLNVEAARAQEPEPAPGPSPQLPTEGNFNPLALDLKNQLLLELKAHRK